MNHVSAFYPAARVAAAGIIFAGLCGSGASAFEIVIGADELQRRVDERLPYQGHRHAIAYSVTRVATQLRDDEKIGVDADIDFRFLGEAAQLRVAGAGKLDYRDGAFFLRQFSLDSAVFKPQAETEKPSRSPLGAFLARQTQRLRSQGLQQFEREARAEAQSLLGAALERYPVYKLKDADPRQRAAKMLLRKIQVRNQTLVVTLDAARQAN